MGARLLKEYLLLPKCPDHLLTNTQVRVRFGAFLPGVKDCRTVGRWDCAVGHEEAWRRPDSAVRSFWDAHSEMRVPDMRAPRVSFRSVMPVNRRPSFFSFKIFSWFFLWASEQIWVYYWQTKEQSFLKWTEQIQFIHIYILCLFPPRCQSILWKVCQTSHSILY